MKSKTQFLKFLLLVTLIISCTKDEGTIPFSTNFTTSSSPPPPVTPPSAGQEFVFDSLIWQYYNSGVGSPWFDEIYVSTPARPDLFVNAPGLMYNPNINAEVFLKLNSVSDWIEVKPGGGFYPPNSNVPYLYYVYAPYLVVNVWPLNHQLVGRTTAIKIKFL